jgi:hypothetical protein
MSIRFWMPGAPVQSPPSEVRVGGGFGPEMLAAAGLPPSHAGRIAPDELATVAQRVQALLVAENGTPPARQLFALATDSHERRYLRTRLAQLAELIDAAREGGQPVCWE